MPRCCTAISSLLQMPKCCQLPKLAFHPLSLVLALGLALARSLSLSEALSFSLARSLSLFLSLCWRTLSLLWLAVGPNSWHLGPPADSRLPRGATWDAGMGATGGTKGGQTGGQTGGIRFNFDPSIGLPAFTATRRRSSKHRAHRISPRSMQAMYMCMPTPSRCIKRHWACTHRSQRVRAVRAVLLARCAWCGWVDTVLAYFRQTYSSILKLFLLLSLPQVYGPWHPDVAISKFNLAMMLSKMGKLQDSKTMYSMSRRNGNPANGNHLDQSLLSSRKNRNSLTWVLVALTVCFTYPVLYRFSAESRAGEWEL